MRLCILRHGASVAAHESRFIGFTDIDLSEEGHRQATRTAAYLARRRFAAVITSDLRRAVATAAIIAQAQTLSLQHDSDLREINYGMWDGYEHAEIAVRDPQEYVRWQKDPAAYPPGGGESLLAVQERMMRSLHKYQARYPTQTILWVSHNGAIRALLCGLLGIDLQRWTQLRIANCGITELDVIGADVIVRCLNCRDHLLK